VTSTRRLAPAASTASTVVLEVQDKSVMADDVVTLTLASPDGDRLRDWTPGAHIDLVLPNGMTRQYSLCGDRWDAFSYRIGVLRERLGRGGSAYVHDVLEVGDTVGVGGPRNNFSLVPSERYLFVAGGVGITPLLPMVQQANLLGADWHLLYGGRHRSSMAFLDELARYGDRVRVVPRDESGLRNSLPSFLGSPRQDVRIYACGPDPMLATMQALCAGWPPHTLHTERFVSAGSASPVRGAPFDVELARTGVTVTVPPDKTILQAVGEVGVEVLSSCRQGVCGTCETAVLAGEPEHRDALLEDHERSVGDCMFICVSRGRGHRLVLDL
jgi:ferredoxin-NADP reductase